MKRKPVIREDLKEQWVSEFNNFETQLNGTRETLKPLREEAIQYFEQLGFPHVKIEDWKYTSLKNVLKPDYYLGHQVAKPEVSQATIDQAKVSDIESNLVVLINGRFSEEHSKIIDGEDQLYVRSLRKAQVEAPQFVEQHIGKYLDYKQDGISALSTAFIDDGVVLHVGRNKAPEYPVQILHIHDVSQHNLFIQPRNLWILEQSAELKVIENFHTVGDSYSFLNYTTEGHVAANAHLKHYRLQNDQLNAYQVSQIEMAQEQDSTISNYTATLGNGFTRNNTNYSVNGENCETNLYGLYLADGKQFVDNHTIVDHKVPRSESNELYKGIVDDRAVSVFNGKVYVRPKAQQTNAYQSNRNILLDDKATVNAKPQLEIWADDVKCSHGATAGQLDENQLFYMRARGLEYDQAQSLLVYAFAAEVIGYIDIEPVKDYINDLIAKKLKISF
jgi:Fe-S cluster assembly protein SufD